MNRFPLLAAALSLAAAAHAQSSGSCDVSGVWIGETRTEGISTPARIELRVTGSRVSGVRPATTVAGRAYPAAPITGEVRSDGTLTLQEAPTNPDTTPVTYNLSVNEGCSMLRGKFTVAVKRERFDGIASYLRQPGAKASP